MRLSTILYIFFYTFQGILLAQNEPFLGGPGDGYGYDSVSNNFTPFSKGAVGDGYASALLIADFNHPFLGGHSDGFAFTAYQDDFRNPFLGGQSDGYATAIYGHTIFWTGAVGNGWSIAENWQNNLIPTNINPVVIPANAINFPFVNAGTLKIGYDKPDADFNCQRIKINTGAELTTRVNSFVVNYNLIFIQGKLFVKNVSPNSFLNLNGAEIIIKNGAQMLVKE